jgi:WD40 repeat protein
VRVWNVPTGECTHTLEGHTSIVSCVAFDGITIVSGSGDMTVRSWRAPYNTVECKHVMEGHMNLVYRVWLCTAPNEHVVVSVDWLYPREGRVLVHDIRTGNRMCAPIECVECKLS